MNKPWKALLLIAAVACVLIPSSASAAGETLPVFQETADTWRSCHDPQVEHPYAFDGDFLDYVLAPSGSFEGQANGWQYFDGAGIAAGNDPFPLQAGTDEQVLNLPPGSSAVSPLMCIDLSFPTFRFPVRQLLGHHEKLKVEVIYPDVAKPKFRKVTVLREDSDEGWVLTDDLPLEPERAGAEQGERRVALRFSVSGGSGGSGQSSPSDVYGPAPEGYQLDDLYVDPRCRN